MLALRFHGQGDLRLDDITEPAAGPNEVKIRVEWCSICGADLHEYLVGPRAVPRAGSPHPLTGETLPVVLGHELTGRVVEIGSGVTGVDIGTQVAVEPLLHDRCCPRCRSGNTNLCPRSGYHGLSGGGGGFASYTVVPAYTVHPLPEGVSPRLGAIVEPLASGWHAVLRTGFRPGGTALVLGAEASGLATLAALRAAGARWVGVADTVTARAELAVRMGADAVLDPRQCDVAERVRAHTGEDGVDVVLECTGADDRLHLALRAVRPRGAVCTVALWEKPAEFDADLLVTSESWLTGSVGYAGDDFPGVLAALADGRMRAEPMITDQVALTDIVDDGFDALLRPEDGHVKVVVHP